MKTYLETLGSASSRVLEVPLTSTVPLDEPLNRPCPEVRHTSGLPNHVRTDVTSYLSLRVGSYERDEEIRPNRKQMTVYVCFVPTERVPYSNHTRLVGR